ncbi:hypothetical protein V1527DRAFT_447254, partial [Lipomyces starkeyi]
FGIILVFSGIFTCPVEAYRPYAASGLSPVPLFASPSKSHSPLLIWSRRLTDIVYDNSRYAWASTLLGFLCLGCTPFSFLFYKFGSYLRKRSRYAWTNQKKRGGNQSQKNARGVIY